MALSAGTRLGHYRITAAIGASLAAAALFVTAPALGQPVGRQRDFNRVPIGGDLSRYEIRYGEPENRSLDDVFEGPETWPQRQAIRTVGRVVPVLRPPYVLSGKAHSLRPAPVEEIADAFARHMPSSLGREVEVVGAFEEGTFLVWSVFVLQERDEDEVAAPRTTLEALVIDPEASTGSVVTVEGTFRGANLFGDFPAESRRHAQDWVLKDGPFFIWVTGAKPEGSDFSLGLQTRTDCRWRLAVQGEVETHDGIIYLRAWTARLLGRARDEPEAEDP